MRCVRRGKASARHARPRNRSDTGAFTCRSTTTKKCRYFLKKPLDFQRLQSDIYSTEKQGGTKP
nr:MAG TPA: hypothetical protein [Caudoviricetes sp.]